MSSASPTCVASTASRSSLCSGRWRGDHRADSDIDILVLFQPEAHIGLIAYADLMFALATLMGRKVDLVDKLGLKPMIRDEVLQEARLLYAA